MVDFEEEDDEEEEEINMSEYIDFVNTGPQGNLNYAFIFLAGIMVGFAISWILFGLI